MEFWIWSLIDFNQICKVAHNRVTLDQHDWDVDTQMCYSLLILVTFVTPQKRPWPSQTQKNFLNTLRHSNKKILLSLGLLWEWRPQVFASRNWNKRCSFCAKNVLSVILLCENKEGVQRYHWLLSQQMFCQVYIW